jgi:carbamoyltransferase
MVRRNIVVLGINDGHDAGAALIKNGEVIAAIQEERLNNIKHFGGVPEKSIVEVFNISHIDPSDVSLISLLGYDPIREENINSVRTQALLRLSWLIHADPFIAMYNNYNRKHRNFRKLKSIFERLGLVEIETCVIEHHLAHASVAYRSSPWSYDDNDDALILTADGSGDGISSTVNIGRRGNIHRIAFSSYYDSVANVLYSEITRFLGLKPWDHEYKVMGLAPYGKAEYCIDKMRKVIRINPSNPLRFQNTIGGLAGLIQPKLRKLLENQRFDNIAAAAQQHLEDLIKNWVRNAINVSGAKKIACAGGLFLNVKANKILREIEGIEEIFFYPAPDDEGSPVGAALQGYYEYCRRDGVLPKNIPVTKTYYGSSFTNDQIQAVLDESNKNTNNNFKYDFHSDIDGIAGELLAKRKILARCSGGVEWGPRALGNRSIIADPQDMKVIHKINFAIKQRDFWMPFSPSILDERRADYLVNSAFAPYMIMAFDSTEEGIDKIAATVHPYDKTCRPQTVKSDWNPSYHKLIKTFESATGVGTILNTSFNLHGYPIVGTPQMALWTLDNSKLDGLILGNYLVTKE